MPPRIPPETLNKLQPKLRMIAGGDTPVNVVRAERCAALAVRDKRLLEEFPPIRGADAAPVTIDQMARRPRTPRLERISGDVLTNVFVYLRDERVATPSATVPPSRSGRIVAVQAPLDEIPALAANPDVAYVELAEPLEAPRPVLADLRPAPPSPSLRRFGKAARHKYGERVLIGIIDVQGFDFSHPDFLDAKGKTRFARIWDQGGDARPSPRAREPVVGNEPFTYGAEFRQPDLNRALRAAARLRIPATDIEKQSQMVEGSHATHVASIAWLDRRAPTSRRCAGGGRRGSTARTIRRRCVRCATRSAPTRTGSAPTTFAGSSPRCGSRRKRSAIRAASPRRTSRR